VIQSIELNVYCAGCGNRLETETKQSMKQYNEIRVEVQVCKTCERNGAFELIQSALKNPAAPVVVKEKKKYAKRAVDAKPVTGKKRGRPAKVKVGDEMDTPM